MISKSSDTKKFNWESFIEKDIKLAKNKENTYTLTNKNESNFRDFVDNPELKLTIYVKKATGS